MWERVNTPTAFPEFDDAAHLFQHIRDLDVLLPDVIVTPALLTILVNQSTAHIMEQFATNHSLLERPLANDRQEPTKIEFMTPSFNLDTAAYEDIIRLLARVHREFIGIYNSILYVIINIFYNR